MSETVTYPDYTLSPENSQKAFDAGLASADWYLTDIPRDKMVECLERRDGPAIRDFAIWFSLLFASGFAGYLLWGSWWAAVPFFIYGTLYASTSNPRWHETSHGTPFKSDWLNELMYHITSFMEIREPVVWRWSHARHHSDTLIVGRDNEIAPQRPPKILAMILNLCPVQHLIATYKNVWRHAQGELTESEKTFIPESEWPKVYRTARVWVAIYAVVLLTALLNWSILPLMYIGIPTLFGIWLSIVYGMTQHAGLSENVLDHRLNSRTVYMHPIHRFLYCNMGYHIEHHMFPLVPYYNLPKLHELMKHDTPEPYPSLWAAWKEIIPAIWKQTKDPSYFVKRELPSTATASDVRIQAKALTAQGPADDQGWIRIAKSADIHKNEVQRLNHAGQTYAVYRLEEDELYITDGICTHGNTHLADGFIKGDQIECPKHNGRFDIKDGSVKRTPVCVSLNTYEIKCEGEDIFVKLDEAKNTGEIKTHEFKVVSNNNVATFIKELVLEPAEGFDFTPGDYLQLDIPAYPYTSFQDFAIDAKYRHTWSDGLVFSYFAENSAPTRRNYSMANNPQKEKQLLFNVRIATPPTGMVVKAGVGSSYVFNLKPGDRVSAIGPFGDFHIKESEKEMVFLGGGAGMAPLRSQISHLFENLNTQRKVSFWYGARSLEEIFYQEYFEALAREHENFSFHLALSEAKPEDQWQGEKGFIHEVLKRKLLDLHRAPNEIEYYLCGPPAMLNAAKSMLAEFRVPEDHIAYDEF